MKTRNISTPFIKENVNFIKDIYDKLDFEINKI